MLVDSAVCNRRDAREWTLSALATLRQEAVRSADTHLLRLDFPGFPGIGFYFKDEAAHPTGSLKHRLARSLERTGRARGKWWTAGRFDRVVHGWH